MYTLCRPAGTRAGRRLLIAQCVVSLEDNRVTSYREALVGSYVLNDWVRFSACHEGQTPPLPVASGPRFMNGPRRCGVRTYTKMMSPCFAKVNFAEMFRADAIEDALFTLGRLLEARGHRHEIVVVGGSALLLLGLISRPTKDLDVMALVDEGRIVTAQPLPSDLIQAISDVAAELGLVPDWLNSGPTPLLDSGLPKGFEKRLDTRNYRSCRG